MARKTSRKSKTSAGLSALDEILISCPGIHVDEARAMLVMRDENQKRDLRDVHFGPSAVKVSAPLEFSKRAKRISRSDADHTLRLSSSSADSKAMKNFLKAGGTITVVPTRNAKGSKPQRIRVAGGFVANRSRTAHAKQAVNARHDSIVASIEKANKKARS